jgi:hypothetical protein
MQSKAERDVKKINKEYREVTGFLSMNLGTSD